MHTVLEPHKGEYIMTEFIFLVDYPFNCNNPVRYLYAQEQVGQQMIWSTQKSDLTIIESIWDFMKSELI